LATFQHKIPAAAANSVRVPSHLLMLLYAKYFAPSLLHRRATGFAFDHEARIRPCVRISRARWARLRARLPQTSATLSRIGRSSS